MANVGQPLMRQMQLLDADKADDLYQVYRKYNHAVHDDLIRPYPGIEDLLRELRRRGALMAIVTS